MATSKYYTVDGEIIGERSVGGASLNYLPDALGSVTASANGTAVSSASYTPYGQGSASTGAAFGWVGTKGYRPTELPEAAVYIRRRTVSPIRGRWLTQDPIWPSEESYAYASGNPSTRTDASGLRSCSEEIW